MRAGGWNTAPLVLVALVFCADGTLAAPPDRVANPTLAVGLDVGDDALRRHDLMARLLIPPGAGRGDEGTLDFSPLAQGLVARWRALGMPLRAHRDMKGRKIAISTLLKLADNMPAVQVHLGASAAGPFGAFYRREKGFRLSLTYPLRSFALRFEGGKRGEYGNLAMAGLQWVHPAERFAAGVGMPLMLNGQDGAVGAVFQLRLKFN